MDFLQSPLSSIKSNSQTSMNLSFKSVIQQQLQQNKTGWNRSFLDGFSQDKDGKALPWMTYPAIEFLKKNLQKNQIIFEFGCGASTLFFAKRVKKVISLETDPRWFAIIKNKLVEQSLSNVEITLMTDGLTNNLYQTFAKNYGEKFDFIVVDSLKRFECAKNSVKALKEGGSLILDDSERKNYQKIFDFFAEKKFTKEDFFGIAPGQLKMKNTTIFSKLL